MLKASWSELFILTSAHSSTPLHLAPLLASVGLQVNPVGAEKVVILLDHIRLIQDQIEKLKKYQIDSAEFSCLKALVLFNSGEFALDYFLRFRGNHCEILYDPK